MVYRKVKTPWEGIWLYIHKLCTEIRQHNSTNRCLKYVLCFCVSSVDRAVCKTKGQACTNPRLVASMLSYNTTFSLRVWRTQKLFCLQQRLPVPVWPRQHITRVTRRRRNGEQGQGRWKERGAEPKCGALSAGSFSAEPHPTFTPTQVQRTQETAQVTDDRMKEEAVNLKWIKEGCHHRGFC